MNDTDLAPTRHYPDTRPEDSFDHPAGEIRLRVGSGLGLRSQLLASGGTAPAFEFPTMTVPA